jgi:hypothetical protein
MEIQQIILRRNEERHYIWDGECVIMTCGLACLSLSSP